MITEPTAPFDEKLASPEGTERTPRTSTSFGGRFVVCVLTIAAVSKRTTVATGKRFKSRMEISPFPAATFRSVTLYGPIALVVTVSFYSG